MKKLLTIAIALLIIGACKKKKEEETPTPTETKGSVEFNVFMKVFDNNQPLNGVTIKIAKTQSELNAGTLQTTLTSDNTGKASWADQEQGSYYYKAIYTVYNGEFTSEGTFNIGASGVLTKNVSMKQTSGAGSLNLLVYKKSNVDSVVTNATVSVAYYGDDIVNSPLATNSTGTTGLVNFTNLNVDTVMVRIQANLGTKSIDTSGFGYYISPNDRNQYYKIELK